MKSKFSLIIAIAFLYTLGLQANDYTYLTLKSTGSINETEIIEFTDSLRLSVPGSTWDMSSIINRFGSELFKTTETDFSKIPPYTLSDVGTTDYTDNSYTDIPYDCYKEYLKDTVTYGTVIISSQFQYNNCTRFVRNKKSGYANCQTGSITYTITNEYRWYVSEFPVPIAILAGGTLKVLDSLSLSKITGYCTSFSHNGMQYSRDSSFSNLTSNAQGVSIFQTEKFVKQISIKDTVYISSCKPYFLIDSLYTKNEIIQKSFSAVGGCDSIVDYHLSFYRVRGERTINACKSYQYDGVIYSSDTTIIDTIYSLGNECDSIVTIHVKFSPSSIDTVNISSCFPYNHNGAVYNADTSITEIHMAMNLCDSIIHYNFHIGDQSRTVNIDSCSVSYLISNKNYSGDSSINDSLKTVGGCDSIVTYNFPKKEVKNYVHYIPACSPYQWEGKTIASDQTLHSGKIYTIGGECVVVDSVHHTLMSFEMNKIAFPGFPCPYSSNKYKYNSDRLIYKNWVQDPYSNDHFKVIRNYDVDCRDVLVCDNKDGCNIYSKCIDLTNFNYALLELGAYFSSKFNGTSNYLRLVIYEDGKNDSIYSQELKRTSSYLSSSEEIHTIDLTAFLGKKIRIKINAVVVENTQPDVGVSKMSVSGVEIISNSEKIDGKKKVKVFPNPFKSTLTVSDLGAFINDLKLFDLNHKLVYSTVIRGFEGTVDLGSINPGVYNLVVTNDLGIFKNLIIKQ